MPRYTNFKSQLITQGHIERQSKMNAEIDTSNLRINTKRTLLRPFEKTDLEDLFAYAKTPGVGEMAGWAHHKNLKESQNALDCFIEGKHTLAISVNDKVIGSIGIDRYDERLLEEFSDKKGRELGFVLAKDYWDQGIMTEVVVAVVNYLFNVEKLDFLVCSHFDENMRSRKVQEKCGFRSYKRRFYKLSYCPAKTGRMNILVNDKSQNI